MTDHTDTSSTSSATGRPDDRITEWMGMNLPSVGISHVDYHNCRNVIIVQYEDGPSVELTYEMMNKFRQFGPMLAVELKSAILQAYEQGVRKGLMTSGGGDT